MVIYRSELVVLASMANISNYAFHLTANEFGVRLVTVEMESGKGSISQR
ncbi:hypothetical protein ABRT01_03700 [Lentibacillus sp. L22]